MNFNEKEEIQDINSDFELDPLNAAIMVSNQNNEF
jgi:hypothetical protein